MSTNAKLGIIAGTGASHFAVFRGWAYNTISTVYGEATAAEGELAGIPAVFLPRHGPGHSIPPQLINYRANIAALKKLGVGSAIGICAVGAVDPQYAPGSLAVISDFIDFTKSRPVTFFDGGTKDVVHTDFTHPYCPRVSNALLAAGKDGGIDVREKCVYLCVEGPRYETSAEIRMFGHWGADVIGMTNVPEVTLAREAGICYGALAVVTNFAAGVSPTPPSHEEVIAVMAEMDDSISALITAAVQLLFRESQCTSCPILYPGFWTED